MQVQEWKIDRTLYESCPSSRTNISDSYETKDWTFTQNRTKRSSKDDSTPSSRTKESWQIRSGKTLLMIPKPAVQNIDYRLIRMEHERKNILKWWLAQRQCSYRNKSTALWPSITPPLSRLLKWISTKIAVCKEYTILISSTKIARWSKQRQAYAQQEGTVKLPSISITINVS